MRLNLKIAIVASGKSQRHIAAQCDIAETRLSEIVRGWAEPRPQERDRIASVLGKDPEHLFHCAEMSA